MGGLLHDLGKAMMPPAILNKPANSATRNSR
jgi:HD-GYP domain-containing protein (c-di-GMP phosphodiesterase class II)